MTPLSAMQSSCSAAICSALFCTLPLSLCSPQLCYAPLGSAPGRLQSAVRSQAVRAASEARETLQLLAAALHADSSQNLERIDEEPPFERRPRHGVPLALEEEHREVETCPCYVKVFLRI